MSSDSIIEKISRVIRRFNITDSGIKNRLGAYAFGHVDYTNLLASCERHGLGEAAERALDSIHTQLIEVDHVGNEVLDAIVEELYPVE